ncbi:helix-turn-helix domain-containing protein [Streptomyces spiramenti]|uniref:Helix-turn-helix domain-containing protein n=1 Tax=Streptomyces spiramenti TaxID=2720606 RepID=A0ABX1AHX8_9ACTN|nr:helix-turn-helix transcriptional regulator [Streptomyces spiramenti]NJP65521.1 helix-turn-helix domain-containing protein [Streptomyces spiramenti]
MTDPIENLLRQADPLPPPGERLRLREAGGLSRAQVAAAVGVTSDTLRRWEAGETTPAGEHRATYTRLLRGLADRYPAPAAPQAPAPAQAAPVVAHSSVPESPQARAARTAHHRHQEQRRTRTTTAEETRTGLRGRIAAAVEAELEAAGGDADAATAALTKRAIPDVMALFALSRKGARYEHTSYPALPPIFSKPSKREADLIWEARPSWRRPGLRRTPDGELTVTALDVNAAYLSALKTHLPIGRLEHARGGEHDRKRAGVYLIDPPVWRHPTGPNPLGDREEGGPLWVTEPTMRLLLRLAGPKYRLFAAPPVVHESWTSGSTETMLDSLRQLLADARADAIAAGDDVTLTYVKQMYAKFVSTIGESAHNREIVRPDWVHLIRSQAFANLWGRAYKAATAGLTVVSMAGTDELHVAGDWQAVFEQGTGLSEMKVKTDPRTGEPTTYTATITEEAR